MTPELALVLALLAAAVVMFIVNRPRMDVVAILMMTLLPLFGLVTVNEALAGLADPNIVLIAALFVLGEGLVRTGVAQRLGDILVRRAGASEARLIVLLMAIVAITGSVMSSTGVVAIFIPIVLRIARNTGTSPGRLMMPLSMAALISGMMTLVATAPNLVVHGELIRQGHAGFAFFSFTPFGAPLLVLAILYMLFARRFLGRGPQADAGTPLPALADWIEKYALSSRGYRLRIAPGSAFAGQTLEALDLRSSLGINIIAIEREDRLAARLDQRFNLDRGVLGHRDVVIDHRVIRPDAATVLQPGDVLFLDVHDGEAEIARLEQEFGLIRLAFGRESLRKIQQSIGMAEVVVPAQSRLVGQTVVTAAFRSAYDLTVIGLRHGRTPIEGPVVDEPIKAGDALLVTGLWRDIERLKEERDTLVLMTLPVEADEIAPAARRAPFAVFSLAVTIVLMVTGIVPNVIAAFIGCLMMGLFKCIDMPSAYRSINWASLILIVGMMPFSTALQATGGVELAAKGLLAVVGEASPRMTLAVIFLVTAVLGLFISNTATAVLMAPVALAIAGDLGASPYPFAMTVALAASAAFMTPVSSPVNTLVVAPGNYGFFDFVRIGVPFAVIALIVCVALVPIVLPLY